MSIATKTRPLPLPSDQEASGRTLGQEEIDLVTEAIRSGTLTSTKGEFVKRLETRWAETLDIKFAYACSHGSAAVHAAVAAIDPEPGDEIITSPITDMGAITPILYQGAIPVFADVDPVSCNVTPESVARAISPRTQAVIVTHLFGCPADMTGIMAVCEKHNVRVIEDCAQAFEAEHRGRPVGTFGDIGVFSLQQGKHITTGEGGLVATGDPDFARRMFLFINKAWGYGDAKPDHYFLALNYRMTELHGAVALAQLGKLPAAGQRRKELARQLTAALADAPGLTTPSALPGDSHSFWRYCLTVDPELVPGGTVALGGKLKERGIFAAPRYIQKPAFECAVIRDQQTFGQSRWPFTLARPEAVTYHREDFPGTYAGLDKILVLPWNERFESNHVDYIAESILESVTELKKAGS